VGFIHQPDYELVNSITDEKQNAHDEQSPVLLAGRLPTQNA